MEVEEIERLLAKFYEGNASELEEEVLKEAFRTEEVPGHLQRDKRLFLSFFSQEADMENVPAGLEDKLNRMIDEKADEEQRFFRRNKTKRNWYWVGGIAATLLLLIGIGYGTVYQKDMCQPTPQDTFSNPEDAYKALQATLIEVSTNLNKGIEQVEATRLDVTKVNQEIENEIKR
ncbi:hypothetical protein [uncultured Bacteroides sp.]|uniref:hypothetical protein n=1 Tax=uncultured Bacteroides sp. TaxID=162156 RepID=UPI0025DB1CDC|nr:hypothetical protein [uncultured Bacteroides sp.]